MSLNLYLLRHGETTFSRSGGHCGWIDPDLTPEGQQMAVAFAETYSSMQWNALYTSPMKRTLATVQPLAKSLGMVPQIREGLKEIHYGDWEGRTLEEVKAHQGEAYSRWASEPG